MTSIVPKSLCSVLNSESDKGDFARTMAHDFENFQQYFALIVHWFKKHFMTDFSGVPFHRTTIFHMLYAPWLLQSSANFSLQLYCNFIVWFLNTRVNFSRKTITVTKTFFTNILDNKYLRKDCVKYNLLQTYLIFSIYVIRLIHLKC